MKTARAAVAFMATLSASMLGLAAVANAATLVDLSGKVLVNAGKGFKPGGEAQSVSSGYRVMASANSQVTVQYDDGCRVTVNPGKVYTVQAKSPCVALASGAPGAGAGAGGGLGAGAGAGGGLGAGAVGAVGGLSGPALVGVGAIVAAGTFGVVQAVNSTNKPSSP